eukprot:g6849.t1
MGVALLALVALVALVGATGRRLAEEVYQAHASRPCGGTRCHPLPALTPTVPTDGLANERGRTVCSHVRCSLRLHQCHEFNLDRKHWVHPHNTRGPFPHFETECDGTTSHYSIVVHHSRRESSCLDHQQGHFCGLGASTGDRGRCECRPRVLHGVWRDWGAWDLCSAHCGDGSRTRTRTCDDPEPRHGGNDCAGPKQTWEFCFGAPADGTYLDGVAPSESDRSVHFDYDPLSPVHRVCKRCEAGYRCSGGSKVLCALGRFAPAGSGTCSPHTVTSCPRGEALTQAPSPAVDGICTPCRAGFFQADEPSTTSACAPFTVISCGAGTELTTFPSAVTDGACTECPSARFQPDGGSTRPCRAWNTCPKGQGYVLDTGSAMQDIACETCTAADYEYSIEDDRSACADHVKCAPGFGSNWESLAESHKEESACAACTETTFSPSLSYGPCQPQAVLSCAKGRALSTPPTPRNDGVCTPCPTGFFQPDSGSTALACTPHTVTSCPKGKALSTVPSASLNGVCTPCATGSYQPSAGSTARTCTAHTVASCPEGEALTTAPSASLNGVCTPCAAGHHQPDAGSAARACTPHTVTYCNAGFKLSTPPSASLDGVCTQCSAGRSQPDDRSTARECALECNDDDDDAFCPKGKYHDSQSSVSCHACTACPQGKYQDSTDQPSCLATYKCTRQEFEVVAPTSSSNRQCGTKKCVCEAAGEAVDNLACAKNGQEQCSTCHAGYYGHSPSLSDEFKVAMGARNGVKARIYTMKKMFADTASGRYSDIMVRVCKSIGMKPVCDNKKYCEDDPKAVYVGQDGHIAYWPDRSNHAKFPSNWGSIAGRFDGVCMYAANGHANGDALCNVPSDSHSWLSAGSKAGRAAGFMCGMEGFHKCEQCGSDSKYQGSAGSFSCVTCPSGSFTSGGNTNTRTSCSRCPAGFTCDGSSVRKECGAGTFSGAGASSCTACPAGQYQDSTGQST